MENFFSLLYNNNFDNLYPIIYPPISDKYSDEFIQRFWVKVIISVDDNCWEWQNALQSKGYGSVNVGRRKTALAHRVAYEITRGEIPDGLLVCHHCDNPRCCNPMHLFVGTIADNNKDCVRKGRNAKGDKNGRCRITDEQVLEMEEMSSNFNNC